MKIKYQFVTGETKEIEVDENLYNQMREITKQSNTINKQEQRKKHSIDTAIEDGKIEYANENEDLQKRKLREKRLEMLPAMQEQLNEKQKDLVNRVFFNDEQLKDIAQENGVSYQSIQKMRDRALAKMKKQFLKKGGV